MAAEYKSSSKAFVASATSLVIPKPPGLLFGDLMLVTALRNAAGSPAWGLPTGWVLFEQAINGNINALIASKVADAADVAATDFTFTHAGAATLNGIISRFGGGKKLELDGTSGPVTNQPLSVFTFFSFNTDTDNMLILRIPFYIFATTEPSSLTPAAGITQREFSDGPGSNDPQIAVFTDDVLLSPPGATGNQTVTPVGFSGNVTGRFYTIGIEPQTGSGYEPAYPFRQRMDRRVEIPKGTRLKNPFRSIYEDEPEVDPRRR